MVKRILPFAALGCTAAGTVCYLLAVLNEYDSTIHHFEVGSTKAVAAAVFCLLSLILGAVCGLLYRKSAEVPAEDTPVPVTFAACASALLTVATCFFTLLSGGTVSASGFVSLIFGAAAAVFFFLLAMGHDKHSVTVIGFSLCPICYALVTMLVVYRSMTYAMNSPVKIYAILMWLAFALYFTEEARNALKRTVPWEFALCAVCAMTFGFMQGVTEIVGSLTDPALSFSLLDGVQHTVIGLLALCRLLTVETPKETENTIPTKGDNI